MLSPFEIRFFRELAAWVQKEDEQFKERIYAAQTIEQVEYWKGYYQALDNMIAEGAHIEDVITTGKD